MAKRVRIEGLVRTADGVRRALAAPITADGRERLRTHAQDHLRRVEQILRAHNARPEHLPAPSHRAYRFLAGLDWSQTPGVREQIADGETRVPPAETLTTFSWRGLGALIDRTLDRLASDVADAELRAMADALTRTSRQIELTIQRRSVAAGQLTPTTRGQRGWLAFFARSENLAAYAQARRAATAVLDRAAAGSRHFPPPLAIQFRAMNGIYRLRPPTGRRQPVLALPAPMIVFDAPAFGDLAALVFDRGRESKRRVIERMTADAYQAVRAELDALGGVVEQARGAVHDLSASFDRVNAAYFGGRMARPRLTWNRTFTGRKFGHYDWILDTVMVSRTLDATTVPQFVVDFLVFHELLHKFHGLHWVNGRGYAHTAEFQESERKFARYKEAESILQQLARQAR